MPPGSSSPNPIKGGGKPNPAEKIGKDEFASDSSLTDSPNTSSTENSGQPKETEKVNTGKGKGAGDKAKNMAASATETAKDVKDVAKAGPTGLEDTHKEIKEGYDKSGAKGAAGAAGREAAGQAVATGVDVLTAGATTESHGKIAKATSKVLKKENLKKIALTMVVIITIPAIIIGLIIGILLYAAQDPAKFLSKVLTDPKTREFAVQAAQMVPKAIFGSEEHLKQYGYVENKPGMAIAQTSAPAPKPGSLADKLTKINLKNLVYQTNSKPDCPYTFTTKEMVGPSGDTIDVIDKVTTREGQEVSRDQFLVQYCIIQSMPLYNLMVRTEKSREVNAFSNTILNYGDDPNFLKDASAEEASGVVYDKTYGRITSKKADAPTVSNENVDDYINNVRKALEEGEDPYSVDSGFKFKSGFDTEDKMTVSTMCTFSQGYLASENLRKGINVRLNTGQRSGMKWNTISSTRELSLMSNREVGTTLKEVENWQASRAYSQNVYGTQTGEAVNPESLSNTSYGAGYQDTVSLIADTIAECSKLNDGGVFSRIFGGTDNSDALGRIKQNYNALRILITAQSNGKFTNPEDFGLQQLMIGVIRMGGGSAVSGLEPGPQNFNNQSQGFRGISNQYMMRMGGRFLTKKEANLLNVVSENTRREVESKNGIAYRLFGEDNIRSLANIIKFETPRNQNEFNRVSRDYLAGIANPLKLVANAHSAISYYTTGKSNQAFAADATGDAYMRLDTIGIPKSMFEGVDLIRNSDEIQNLQANGTADQKRVLGYFDQCAKSNIPSKAAFVRTAPIVNGKPDRGFQEVDGWGYPYYVAMADKIEYPKSSPEAQSNPDPDRIGDLDGPRKPSTVKEEKRAFMACEIYLGANPTSSGDSGSTIPLNQRRELFGFEDVEGLAKKYQVYLYSNSIADLMVELSSTEKTDSIYSNGRVTSGSSGSTIDGVECPANLGEPNSQRHNYYQLPSNPEAYASYTNPDRQYGSKELVCALYTVGKAYKAAYPNSILNIGDLNAAGHESHNWGVAVDLSATPVGAGGVRAADNTRANYSTEATIKLGQLFVDTGIIQDIWWCDAGDGSIAAIKDYATSKGLALNIKCLPNHYNHFHVNINCKFAGPIDLPGFANPSKPATKPCSEEIQAQVGGAQ